MKKITRNTYLIWIHLLTWLFFLSLGVLFFTGFWPLHIAIIRALANGTLYAVIFYGNAWLLFPRFFLKRQFLFYGITSVIMLAGVIVIRLWLMRNVYGPPQNDSFPQLSYLPGFFILASFIFVWFLSLVMKLSDQYIQQERTRERLEAQKLQAELQLLKAQVNPHFLFNTLNNIYSLAYRNDPRTPGSLMSLSEMMRYMIYEAGHARVPINREITFINDFISLQELRLPSKPLILLDVQKFPDSLLIEPLLLIPFVENLFKHGIVTDREKPAVISLKIIQNQLVFKCENQPANTKKPEPGGFGLKNVQQRLDALYPGKHNLTVSNQPYWFKAEMILEIYTT